MSEPAPDDSTPPDDYDGHFVDPFEITSSSIFIIIGLMSFYVFLRMARHFYRYGFKTHYQKIFFVCTANDLVVHYGSLLRVRTSTWGVFEWYWYIRDGPIPLIIGLFVEYSILFQVLGTLLIAVNRATSMAMPHKYEKIWGFYTWHFIGGTAVIPLLYCIPSFTASSFFARFGWGYYIPYTLQNNSIGQFFDDVYFPICVAIVALTLLVNAYTGIKLFAYTKKLKKRELTFHIATLGQFIAQLINTAELILVNTLNINEYYMVFQFQPVCADIANFMPLWFLLLISEETRKMVTGKLTKADMNTTMTAGVSVVDSGKQNWGSQRRIQPNSRSMYGNKE